MSYDPVTGQPLGTGYDDHAAAVTSSAAELHRAGIGHRLGFRTEIGHRLAGGYVQRADLVVRAPEAGVPVLLLEIDRRTEDAHDLVHKLRRYGEWGRLLPKDADRHTVDLVRSRPDAIEHVDHEKRLWRRVYPPTGREGLVPLAFVFADTTKAKVDNTVAVLGEAGRRFWAPRRYETYYQEVITAKDCGQVVPVVFTTLEQLTEHDADAAVWWRLGREGEQTLTAALDSPDGYALYRRQRSPPPKPAVSRPPCSRSWRRTAARSRAGPAVACSAAAAAPPGDATRPAGQGGAVRAVARSGRGGLLRQRGERGAPALLHRAQPLPVDLGVRGDDRVHGGGGIERVEGPGLGGAETDLDRLRGQ